MSNKAIRYISMPSGDVLSFAGPQYCTCSSSATAKAKYIELSNIGNENDIPDGYAITVRMKNAQLYNGIPELTVRSFNQTYPIYRGNGVPAGYNEWQAGDIVTLVYGTSEVETEVEGETYFESVWFIIGPIVPLWARQSTKPTYTASEVGALPYPYKFDSVDLDKADNGITNTISKPFDITDINGRPVGKFAAEASPDGSTKCGIWTYNRRNGNNYGMGLSVSQAKDGTTTYYISEPTPFRDAINVYSKTEIDNKVATLAETKSYLGIS